MRSPIIFSIALFLPLTSAYTYWIDPKTCTADKLKKEPQFGDDRNKGNPWEPFNPILDEESPWESLLSEVKDLGGSALERIGKQTENPDFSRAWRMLFKTKDNDRIRMNAGNYHVRSYLQFINGLGKAVDQTQANVRIYCDNDDRWVKKQDGRGWKDMGNRMSTRNAWCREDKGVLAVTYTDADEVKNHHAVRSTITLCNTLFTKARQAEIWQLSDIPTGKDFSADHKSINWIRNTVTALLLHELSHCPPIFALDAHGDASYGWNNVVDMLYSEGTKNADSYMYIVLMAFFADRKYGLDRRGSTETTLGELVKYNDIPKRAGKEAAESLWN